MDRLVNVVLGSDDIEDPASQFHNTQAMFEAFVCRSGVDHVGHRQLVDVPESLDWRRVEHTPLVAVQRDEPMNRVSDLVIPLGGQGEHSSHTEARNHNVERF